MGTDSHAAPGSMDFPQLVGNEGKLYYYGPHTPPSSFQNTATLKTTITSNRMLYRTWFLPVTRAMENQRLFGAIEVLKLNYGVLELHSKVYSFLHRIREVQGSNNCPETNYPDGGVSQFSCFQQKSRFLSSHRFPFTKHRNSPCEGNLMEEMSCVSINQ
jgi:hypothetical protein